MMWYRKGSIVTMEAVVVGQRYTRADQWAKEEMRAQQAKSNLAKTKAERNVALKKFPVGTRVTNGKHRGTVRGHEEVRALLKIRIDHFGRDEYWPPDPTIVKKI